MLPYFDELRRVPGWLASLLTAPPCSVSVMSRMVARCSRKGLVKLRRKGESGQADASRDVARAPAAHVAR